MRSAITWHRGATPSCRSSSRRSRRTKSLDDSKLGDYIRANTFKTVLGDVKFGSDGEWAQSRVLQVQFRNIKSNDLAQFKDISTQVVVAPAEYESGKLIYPYEKAQ